MDLCAGPAKASPSKVSRPSQVTRPCTLSPLSTPPHHCPPTPSQSEGGQIPMTVEPTEQGWEDRWWLSVGPGLDMGLVVLLGHPCNRA